MAVVIQEFEAVQAEAADSPDGGGKPRPAAPVASAALDRLITVRRARHLRLWAN